MLWWIHSTTSKDAFVRFVLQDLPPQPAEFGENRRKNLGEA